MGQFTEVQGPDGSFDAYLALPEGGSGPGVVILAEIYNVNGFVKQVADLYAAAGYVALAPDLFWRQEPGLHMDYTPENQVRGRALAAGMDAAAAVRDIDTCIDYLKARPGSSGKVGLVGFCLGGQLAYLSAASSNPDAISVYYGTRLHEMTQEARKIRCPAQLHFAEADVSIPVAAAYEIEELTAGMSNVEVFVYADAPHAFGRFGYPPYREDHAKLAQNRTFDLFRKALL